eukprot:TRINITY_DN25_c3_g1_i1.p1 TRINITY_DN25_c3_g1~~TRINITY_DN25_c3_g1_i1.p1  ORF type:complete len:943 (-),score=362.72 TRINITY_DN25_c3_g1_i1:34-2772(-)
MKKKGLILRLKEQHREIEKLQKMISEFEDNKIEYNSNLIVINRNWNLFEQQLQQYVVELEESENFKKELEQFNSYFESLENKNVPPLLQQLLNPTPNTKSSKSKNEYEYELVISESINQRANTTLNIFSKIVKYISNQRYLLYSLIDKIKSNHPIDKVLIEINEKLTQENKSHNEKYDQLHKKYLSLQSQLNNFSQISSLDKEKLKELDEKIYLLEESSKFAERKMDKQNNEIQRLLSEIESLKLSNVVQQDPLKSSQPLSLHSSVHDLSQPYSSLSQSSAPPLNPLLQTDQKEVLGDYQFYINDLQKRLSEKEKLILELEERNNYLIQEENKVKSNLEGMTEMSIKKSHVYAQLEDKLKYYMEELSQSKQNNESLCETSERNSIFHSLEIKSLKEKFVNEKNILTKELEQAKQKISSFRNHNDELLLQLQSKTSTNNDNLSQEFEILKQNYLSRIEYLEKKNEELKKDLQNNLSSSSSLNLLLNSENIEGGNNNNISDNNNNNISDEKNNINNNHSINGVGGLKHLLIKKDVLLDESNQKNGQLTKEIESLRQRLLKCEEEKGDLQLLLSVHQTSTTEQREIEEIRKQEKKLQNENKKLLELIESLKLNSSENSVNESEDSTQKQISVQKEINLDLKVQIEELKRTKEEIGESLSFQKKTNESLIKEMNSIHVGYEALQEQNERILSKMSNKEEDNQQILLNERQKSKQLNNLLKDEIDILTVKIAKLKELTQKQKLTIEELQNLNSQLDLLRQNKEETKLQYEIYISINKKQSRDLNFKVVELSKNLESKTNQYNELKKKTEENNLSHQKILTKISKTQEENGSLERRLQREKEKFNNQNDNSQLEEELREYQQILKCSVCNDRRKDAIITRCMHMFCKTCIEENLRLRQRSCPGCGINFGQNDVKSIYL